MATRLDISSAASFDFDDADTIEMELTPAQMLVLTQAAAVSQSPPALPAPAPVVIVSRITHHEVTHHAPVKHRIGVRLAIALGVVGAAVVLSGVAYVAGKRSAPVQVVTITQPPPAPVALPPPVAEVPVAQVDPVRFANPFDRSEVFEFPPGTSRDEARDAVAELLLERARVRQSTNGIEQATTNGLVQSR